MVYDTYISLSLIKVYFNQQTYRLWGPHVVGDGSLGAVAGVAGQAALVPGASCRAFRAAAGAGLAAPGGANSSSPVGKP